MINKKSIFIICIFILSINTYGQNEQSYIKQKSKGFIIGTSFINEKLPENNFYQVYQLIYNYSFPLLNQKSINKHNLQLQCEPQINPIFLKGEKMQIELGVNFGLIYNHQITKNLLLDIGIGTGLHYISINTLLQAKGFIFSDNLILGISKRMKGKVNDWEISIQFRFRHMSNLDFNMPNKGIDNFIFYCGISKLL